MPSHVLQGEGRDRGKMAHVTAKDANPVKDSSTAGTQWDLAGITAAPAWPSPSEQTPLNIVLQTQHCRSKDFNSLSKNIVKIGISFSNTDHHTKDMSSNWVLLCKCLTIKPQVWPWYLWRIPFCFRFHLSPCLDFSYQTWCQWHPLCRTGLG